MTIPKYLSYGDTIGIVAPSGFLAYETVLTAQNVIEEWGYKVILGKTTNNQYNYFSGTDEERCTDLQAMLDNPNVKAIIMGRGGYGLSRIIEKLNFEKFSESPKWICGFSDITILHSFINRRLGIATIHSPMCGSITPETKNSEHILSLKNALEGIHNSLHITYNANNKVGTAQANLIGGNLAILAHLTGTKAQLNTDGKILFIEDVGEYLYAIDRMLMQLKLSGQLANLAGLVCGGFTELKDTDRPFGTDIYNIILEKVKEYDYPVCFDIPTGHQDINYAIALGLPYSLSITQDTASLSYNAQDIPNWI